MDIMKRVHDALPGAFPQCEYELVETESFEHDEILPEGNASAYLQRFAMQEAVDAFSQFGNFTQDPVGRLQAQASDGSWKCRCGVERSHLIDGGLFVDLHVSLGNQSALSPFEDKLDSVLKLTAACLTALGLEVASDVT